MIQHAGMNLALNSPIEAPYEAGKDLSVVISCADSSTVAPACEALEIIGRFLKGRGRLMYRWWNFEVLTVASLRKLAAREAAAADLIIISTHAGRKLPREIADWINQWLLLRQQRPGVLVALVDADATPKANSPGVLSQLKKVAKLGRLNFFPNGTKGFLRAALAEGTKCRRPAIRRVARTRAHHGLPGGAPTSRRKHAAQTN